MFESRPSHKKVVGVSHRYLEYEENHQRMLESWDGLGNDNLSIFKLYGLFVKSGVLATRQVVEFPAQKFRKGYLHHAREIEGLAPGQENITAYAYVASGSKEMYPRVKRSIE